ncbi:MULTISPECIES: DUF421 domain-containing protein [Allobacillus]|uniref:DUF421 domain-containing protein n=1 Tax=Allobacillus salarius TaxID=1955272 RepID=A0A556PLP1_9BACI|nr:YetF domain-containing protein [Allobacillus salarius]TSJ65315.1 DUF421 domain-containing protein [Allobacillus salarius]
MMFQTIAVSLIIGLVGIVIITRVLGRKELSQVTPLDFVYALILGGIIEESIYDDQAKFYHIIFALALWALLIWLLETLIVKYDKLRPILKGRPITLVKDGKLNIRNVEKAKLETEQIRTLLRMQGIFSIEQVQYAILETSGLVSVIKKARYDQVDKDEILEDFEQNYPSYLFIEEGNISERDLKSAGKTKDWLLEQLKDKEIELDNVYFAEWHPTGGFNIQTYDS